ncbi:MAG: N-formylglutamate amidohydrolase [Burkholderiales bacterium]|nr:N-formylglutamate amidohydrolase [Burkholderiales bacterium]
MSKKIFRLITCEHGGNRIPARYRKLFENEPDALETHEGFDDGALALARDFVRELDAFSVTATTSRLLIDLNRSLGHPGIFSRFTGDLTQEERDRIVEKHYLPYRQAVEDAIAEEVRRGRTVLHVSAHSFTPELDGEVRNADVGLLYDPARKSEAEFCRAWKAWLAELAPELKVRFNYPYAGKADGFTSWLRKCYTGAEYAGIEVEVNQAHVLAGTTHWRRVRKALAASLRNTVAQNRIRKS